jgi:hypothetical protein
MTNSIFREGGPHKICRIGSDEYTMSISLPTDADGQISRDCLSQNCSPGYFKVKPWT